MILQLTQIDETAKKLNEVVGVMNRALKKKKTAKLEKKLEKKLSKAVDVMSNGHNLYTTIIDGLDYLREMQESETQNILLPSPTSYESSSSDSDSGDDDLHLPGVPQCSVSSGSLSLPSPMLRQREKPLPSQ